MTITIRGIEYGTINECLQWADADGDRPIMLGGRYFVVSQSEAERLESSGVAFAYLYDHEMPDGTYRIVTVPVN